MPNMDQPAAPGRLSGPARGQAGSRSASRAAASQSGLRRRSRSRLQRTNEAARLIRLFIHRTARIGRRSGEYRRALFCGGCCCRPTSVAEIVAHGQICSSSS